MKDEAEAVAASAQALVMPKGTAAEQDMVQITGEGLKKAPRILAGVGLRCRWSPARSLQPSYA